MQIINVHQANADLSQILEEVAEGKEVILAKSGKLIAVISPFRSTNKKRRFFQLEGEIKIGSDFQQTPTDFEAAFKSAADSGPR